MEEDTFRMSVETHLSRLRDKGLDREKAIDLLLTYLRDDHSKPITEHDIEVTIRDYGVNREDALRALVVREELRSLKEQGMEPIDAVHVLISRLSLANFSPRREQQHEEFTYQAASSFDFSDAAESSLGRVNAGMESFVSNSTVSRVSGVAEHRGIRRKRSERDQSFLKAATGEPLSEMDCIVETNVHTGIYKRPRKEQHSQSHISNSTSTGDLSRGNCTAFIRSSYSTGKNEISLEQNIDDSNRQGSSTDRVPDSHIPKKPRIT